MGGTRSKGLGQLSQIMSREARPQIGKITMEETGIDPHPNPNGMTRLPGDYRRREEEVITLATVTECPTMTSLGEIERIERAVITSVTIPVTTEEMPLKIATAAPSVSASSFVTCLPKRKYYIFFV